MKTDVAEYDWDYCYQTDVDTHGLAACIAYTTAGDRTVRLDVDDEDGDGFTNDAPKWDELLVAVTMTVETDWMSGYELVSMDVFPGRWSGAGYSSVVVDGQHDMNCTYHEHLYDFFPTDAGLTNYLNGYENQSCDLYLMGIDKFSKDPAWDYAGYCWDCIYSCICRGKGAGLGVELHEPACHDADIMNPHGIGHCTSGDPCACTDPVSADKFCDTCKLTMRNVIISRGP
jgi:hypothetical protein